MQKLVKRITALLPDKIQAELKRIHCRRNIRLNKFSAGEPEFDRLADWIKEGDWAIDVGANIGQYTKRMSDLAGASGRVVAIEPVPETFALLSANAENFTNKNVTLLNIAASSSTDIVGIDIPSHSSGLKNFYQAHLSSTGSLKVLSVSVDSLELHSKIRLIKIDAEGHELAVLMGMVKTIEANKPVFIIEANSNDVTGYLAAFGYGVTELSDSPNRIFSPL